MKRVVRVWTWDRGERPLDMDGDERLIRPVLETILNGALWRELRSFPPDVVERLLPSVEIPANVRRLVEIWLEEKRRPAA